MLPTDGAVGRLVGMLLVETDNECQVARRYMSLESMKRLTEPEEP